LGVRNVFSIREPAMRVKKTENSFRMGKHRLSEKGMREIEKRESTVACVEEYPRIVQFPFGQRSSWDRLRVSRLAISGAPGEKTERCSLGAASRKDREGKEKNSTFTKKKRNSV